MGGPVNIPSMYAAQQGMVGSGMFQPNMTSQFSPEYLTELSQRSLTGGTGNPFGPNGGTRGPNGGIRGPNNLPPGSGWEPGGGNLYGMGGQGRGGVGGDAQGESGVRYMPPYAGNRPNDWMPDWMHNAPQGSMGGLNLAENGRLIGSSLAALTGIPGLGMLGNMMGNQYINSHVFQSPFDGGGSDPMADFNNSIVNNFNGLPSSPMGIENSGLGNWTAGRGFQNPGGSTFGRQWNWAHAPYDANSRNDQVVVFAGTPDN